MLRLKLIVAGVVLTVVGRWLGSRSASWSWTDWLALPVLFFAAWQFTTAFAPGEYCELMALPRRTWTENQQLYADKVAKRLKWFSVLFFVVLYALAFTSA